MVKVPDCYVSDQIPAQVSFCLICLIRGEKLMKNFECNM